MLSLGQFFYDRYRSLEVAEHRLLYLFLEVTRKCNLSCLHCGSDCRVDLSGPALSTESWFSIVDYASSRFSKDLLFVITGGEPLICPSLPEIGRRIIGNRRSWGIVTNGFLLDERMMGRLVDAGMRSITVSLDGDREAHNHLRNNPQAFDHALRSRHKINASHIARSRVYSGSDARSEHSISI